MKKLIIAIVFLAVAGFGIWYFFFDTKTEEELIREQLDGLVPACSKNSKGGVTNEKSVSI